MLCRPVRRLVRGDGDLRAGHVCRVPPGAVVDPGQRLPHAGDPLGADREDHVVGGGGAGQVPGEVPGVGAQRDLPPGRRRPVPDSWRQRGQRPPQQRHCGGAGVFIPGQQVGGQRDLGLGPGCHVRPPGPLPLVGVGNPALLVPVHLHVGGVDVDGHRPFGQLRGPLGGQQARHPRGRRRQPGFGAAPVPGGEPARDPGRGGGGQARHRNQVLARLIGAQPVQADQEVFSGQLRRGHPGQHLPAGKPPPPGLDRPDPRIQCLDQAELAAQFGDREHPARPGQRRIRRADLDPAAGPGLLTCCHHHTGDLLSKMIQLFRAISFQKGEAFRRTRRGASPIYSLIQV